MRGTQTALLHTVYASTNSDVTVMLRAMMMASSMAADPRSIRTNAIALPMGASSRAEFIETVRAIGCRVGSKYKQVVRLNPVIKSPGAAGPIAVYGILTLVALVGFR